MPGNIPEEVGLITLKVRDINGISEAGSLAHLFTYPPAVTLQEFVNDCAKRFNVPINEFELVYQDLKKGEIVRSEFIL